MLFRSLHVDGHATLPLQHAKPLRDNSDGCEGKYKLLLDSTQLLIPQAKLVKFQFLDRAIRIKDLIIQERKKRNRR